jgi:hypothetical protein
MFGWIIQSNNQSEATQEEHTGEILFVVMYVMAHSFKCISTLKLLIRIHTE